MQDQQAYGGFARAVTIGDAWLLQLDVECLYGLIGLKMLAEKHDDSKRFSLPEHNEQSNRLSPVRF